MMFDPRLPARFWQKVIPEPMSGCWLWVGATSSVRGYGMFGFDSAHRMAYEALVASLPKGLRLRHRCKTACCVNPDHLRPKTVIVRNTRSTVFCSIDGCQRRAANSDGMCSEHFAESPPGRERQREYDRRNRAKPEYKVRVAAWQRTLTTRYKILLRRASLHGWTVEISSDDHARITAQGCVYCGEFSAGHAYVGVDRADSSVGYTLANSVPCCAECNYMKRDVPQAMWLEKVATIAAFRGYLTIGEGTFNQARDVGGDAK